MVRAETQRRRDAEKKRDFTRRHEGTKGSNKGRAAASNPDRWTGLNKFRLSATALASSTLLRASAPLREPKRLERRDD